MNRCLMNTAQPFRTFNSSSRVKEEALIMGTLEVPHDMHCDESLSTDIGRLTKMLSGACRHVC